MTYNPATLVELGRYWTSKGGVNLGVVGNTAHCTGYHLGEDRIFGTCACRNPDTGACIAGKRQNDYSVQHPRDKAGLTNAASAIDLGRVDGSLAELREFSLWLVARCLARKPDTADIREVIYWNPDTDRVERYSGIDGEVHWGPGNGDLSHKTHTHISYFRDSEFRDKRPAFIPYFNPLPDSGTEDPMGLKFTLDATRDAEPFDALGTAKQKAGTAYRVVRVSDLRYVDLPDASDLGVVAIGTIDPPLEEQKGAAPKAGDRKRAVFFTHAGEAHAALLSDVVFTPLPKPIDSTPFSQADIDAATAPLRAQLTTVKAATLEKARTAAVTAVGVAIDKLGEG